MIKVAYKHPPRKWDFYAGYLLWMILVSLPVLLIFYVWSSALPLALNLICLVVLLIWAIGKTYRRVLKVYVLQYDKNIEKSEDVSHLAIKPPDGFVPYFQVASSLGFHRFGEQQAYAGLDEKPQVVWIMINDNHDICLQILISSIGLMAQFTSWFEDNQLIQTRYPIGQDYESETYITFAINTSLEAAFQFHSRKVAEYERHFGPAVKTSSMADLLKQDKLERELYLSKVLDTGSLRFLFRRGLEAILRSGMYYLILGIPFLIFNQSYIQPSLAVSYGTTAMLLLLTSIVHNRLEIRGRDISQAKKKEA